MHAFDRNECTHLIGTNTCIRDLRKRTLQRQDISACMQPKQDDSSLYDAPAILSPQAVPFSASAEQGRKESSSRPYLIILRLFRGSQEQGNLRTPSSHFVTIDFTC